MVTRVLSQISKIREKKWDPLLPLHLLIVESRYVLTNTEVKTIIKPGTPQVVAQTLSREMLPKQAITHRLEIPTTYYKTTAGTSGT